MFSKNKIIISVGLITIYLIFGLYGFCIINAWGHALIMATIGCAFILVVYYVYHNQYDRQVLELIFTRGLYVLLCIGILVSIWDCSSVSSSLSHAKLNDTAIESRMTRVCKDLSKYCKDMSVYRKELNGTYFFSCLKNKKVYVKKGVENDFRVETLTGYINKHIVDMKLVNNAYIDSFYISPQLEIITWEYDDCLPKKLFMIMGNDWNVAESIFVSADGEGNIWAIPEGLVEKEAFLDTKDITETLHFTSSRPNGDMYKVFWNYSDASILLHGNQTKTQRIKTAVYAMGFLVFLSVIGCLFCFIYFKGKCSYYDVFLYLSVGIMIGTSALMFLQTLQININIYSLIVMCIFISSIPLLFLTRSELLLRIRNMKYGFDYYSIIAFFTALSIYTFFCLFPTWYAGFGDSIYVTEMGRSMAYLHGWGNSFARISSFAILMPLLTAGSVLFHVDTLYYLIPTLSMVSMIFIVCIYVEDSDRKTRKSGYMVLLAAFFVASTPMFLLNSMAILNNLPIGLLIGSAVALMMSKRNSTVSSLGSLLFVFSCCLRVEGPIYGSLLLLVLDIALDYKTSCRCAAALLLSSLGLYILNYAYFNPTYTDFWTPSKGVLVLLSVFFVYIYIYLKPKVVNNFSIIYQHRIRFLNMAMLLLPFGYSVFFNYAKVLNNVQAYWHNTVFDGYYGILWVIIGILTIFALFCLKKNNRSFVMAEMIFLTFLFGFDIMLFRSYPIFCKVGDSSARMLLHILPCTVLFIVYFWEDIMNTLRKEPQGPDLQTINEVE